jgi:hypothetical protein
MMTEKPIDPARVEAAGAAYDRFWEQDPYLDGKQAEYRAMEAALIAADAVDRRQT